jgi:rhamnulose-1-phosphate aldolase/alcohol dehydrogenase
LTQTELITAESRWDAERAAGLDPLEGLAYRSGLLGADRSIANFGGGNTSIKATERDHLGRETRVLWVKGSGTDLATIRAEEFTGLRLEEIAPLRRREEMPDAEMVAYLARCQIEPSMPRSSIETLLHAFIEAPHVDHTHPDAIGAIAGAVEGESLARECFGDEAVWVPYLRPGFRLSKLVADALDANPAARFVILAKHGLVTWGESGEESYEATLEAINRAGRFIAERADGPALGASALPEEQRRELLAAVLPTLRGAVSAEAPKVLVADSSDPVADFTADSAAAAVSQVGAACPDHLVHTKRKPLWIDYDPAADDFETVRERISAGVERFRAGEREYFERNRGEGDEAADPNPRVVAIAGVGIVGVGKDRKAAGLSRDLYHRAIAVMRGATALGGFVSLDEAESYAVEYWPLELYKLSLAPPPRELAGRVALVTGGAGGIGGAIVERLAADGACVVVADLDGESATATAARLGDSGTGVEVDVTDEDAVARAYESAVLAYGGVDVVVACAGIASSAPIEEATLAEWERNHGVLARGYFLVARAAAAVLRRQGRGGSVVFIGSKNALAAGRNAVAYSSAKAAELHMARCLAEELGPDGIRVNTVNPDAVLEGSRIWDSSWREERARAYGIEPDQLEEHYRQRTTLKVAVLPADIAEAVAFLASPGRAAKSTGNVINVDGGVPAAYPR